MTRIEEMKHNWSPPSPHPPFLLFFPPFSIDQLYHKNLISIISLSRFFPSPSLLLLLPFPLSFPAFLTSFPPHHFLAFLPNLLPAFFFPLFLSTSTILILTLFSSFFFIFWVSPQHLSYIHIKNKYYNKKNNSDGPLNTQYQTTWESKMAPEANFDQWRGTGWHFRPITCNFA